MKPGIIGLLALTCICLFAGFADASRVLLDRVVAVVNSEVVAWSEVRDAIPPDRIEAAKQLSEDEARDLIRYFESRALEGLIEQKLQLQAAKKMGIEVTDDELDAAILDIQSKYGLSKRDFLASLAKQHLELETYRKTLRGQIVTSRLVNAEVGSRVVISDEQVEEKLRQESPELLQQSREAHLKLIRLEMTDPGDREAVEDLALQIRSRIRKGESFAELARLHSKDPSREYGGDIGFVRRGTITREIEDAAFELDAGELSNPLFVGDSCYLVFVEAFRDRSAEIEEKKEAVRNRLYDEAFQETYISWLRELKAAAHIEIKAGKDKDP